jgi:CRP-like cAMP-binding protein
MSLEIHQPEKSALFALGGPEVLIDAPPLRVRLAQVILDLAECAEIDVANSIFVTSAISNSRLAALAGGKPKTVARMIEQFKIRGLVETRRERLIIRHPEKLQDIVARSA